MEQSRKKSALAPEDTTEQQRAFEQQVGMMLVRHADATMQLDVDVRIRKRGLVGHMLGCVHVSASIRTMTLECRCRIPHLRAGGFRAQFHVRTGVSDGLVRSDFASEGCSDFWLFFDVSARAL